MEHCDNEYKQQECPNFWDDAKSGNLPKANENVALQHVGSKMPGIAFEVDMIGAQNKMMTYRASLLQNQVIILYVIRKIVSNDSTSTCDS